MVQRVIEAKVTGNGSYNGVTTALSDYSYTEDSTPIDPSSTDGGVGSLSLTFVENPNSNGGTLSLMNDTITLTDGSNGVIAGVVNGVDTNNGVSNVTAPARTTVLLNPTTAPPFQGTLSQVFSYYLGLANITTGIIFQAGTYRVDSNAVLSYPGWTGDIWDSLRQWAQSVGGEISLVSNNIVMRPIRQRTATAVNDTSVELNVQAANIAQTVQVNFYQNTYSTSGMVFPDPNQTGAQNIYQVNVNETQINNEPITATLTSVTQPTCTTGVPYGQYFSSQYAVIDNQGALVQPATWLNAGGYVNVAIGADKQSVDITVHGPSYALAARAPFSIATSLDANTQVAALNIVGTGNFTNPQTLTIYTGADPALTTDVVGTVVDNPFISTADQAWQAGRIVAGSYCGPDQTLNVTSTSINRVGDTGSLAAPSFSDFDSGLGGAATNWTGQAFSAFDTVFTGKTFAQFDTQYIGLVSSNFTNQAFGNVGGARRKYRDAYYRIDSATLSPSQITYSATRDTLFGDFDTIWALTPFEGVGPNPRTAAYNFDDYNAAQSGAAVKRNLIGNPSFEQNLNGWAAWGGGASTGTISQFTTATTTGLPSNAGPTSMQVTFATASNANAGPYYTFPQGRIIAGSTYSAGMYINSNSSGHTVYAQFEWLNSAGTQIGSSGAVATTLPASTWTLIKTENVVAPANTTSARITFYSPQAWAAGSVVYNDAAMANVGSTLNTYFDGNTSSTSTTRYGLTDPNVDLASYSVQNNRTFQDFTMSPLWRNYAGYAATQPH